MPDFVTRVRSALAAAADQERAAAQQRYMKSAMPFHGVAMARVRRIVQDLAAEYRIEAAGPWRAIVLLLWDGATHREERYAATALARHRAYREFRTAEALPMLRHMIVTGAWWDHVDEIASHLLGDVLQADPEAVTPVLRQWADDGDMWLRRSAILAQLRAKGSTDTELLAYCLRANLGGSRYGEQFFIRKAIGWALREYAKTDPGWVRTFLDQHRDRLSPLSVREASKHLSGT